MMEVEFAFSITIKFIHDSFIKNGADTKPKQLHIHQLHLKNMRELKNGKTTRFRELKVILHFGFLEVETNVIYLIFAEIHILKQSLEFQNNVLATLPFHRHRGATNSAY
jgi:hypothetical protein